MAVGLEAVLIVVGVALQLLLVVAVVVASALFAWRRLDASVGAWGWGAATFAAAFAVRTAVLVGVTAVANRTVTGLSSRSVAWVNLAVLAVTAGLFEEGARWLVLRRFARNVRRPNDGVMYGLGHGGLEALLLVGLGAAVNLLLLVGGEEVITGLAGGATEAREAVQAQVQALRGTPGWMPILAGWERVLAMTLHVAATLLVLRTVRDRRLTPFWYAVLLHIAFNALAGATAQQYGAVVSELVLTVLTVIPIAIIVHEWRSQSSSSERPTA